MINFKKHILNNGLRIVYAPLQSTKAVTVFVASGAGSRYETVRNNGIAHFIEHMFFKGGKKYPSTKAVASALDGVGGEFNAMTSDEWVAYYVKVARPHVELAFDVLSDMLLHARFPETEIRREQGVILEEYNMLEDTPMAKVGDLFENLLFGESSVGLPTIGTPQNIKSFKRKDFISYERGLYTTDNMVIAVVGGISNRLASSLARHYFKMPAKEKSFGPAEATLRKAPAVKLVPKKTQQFHLVLGVPAFGVLQKNGSWHPDRYVLKVLATILGGNMSSRLFLAVRERKGLAYYIRTIAETYTDAGYLATSAGVDLQRVGLAIQKIIKEYQRIAREGVRSKELKKAKEFIKGKMILGLEDSNSIAARLSLQELLYRRIEKVEDSLREVDQVTSSDVVRVARQLFKPEALRLALIGPSRNVGYFTKLLLLN